ncbi:MAG: monovalent cation/H+ antiporter complex subunit F [bacterium]|nr:monovalent cation/H+ antiporter complex subunit F [bacterium]
MDHVLLIFTVLLLFLIILVLIRALIGPTVMDRLVAVNVIGTKTTVVLVFVGFLFHQVDMFVDIALAYGLLNFIVSIAAAKYFCHYQDLEPK